MPNTTIAEFADPGEIAQNESRCEKTGLPGFPTRANTNRAVQSQKMVRGL